MPATSLLLVFTMVVAASPESELPDQQPSAVVVLKNKWRKGVRGSDMGRSIFDPSQTRTRNPSTDDPFQRMRQAGRQMPLRVDGYYYSATIRNDGAKTIKALIWDYTISSPADPGSLTHHQFYSRVEIRPGKRKDVYKFTVTPPTLTVSAAKGEARLIEEVVVKVVQYKDGSVWKLPPKQPDGPRP